MKWKYKIEAIRHILFCRGMYLIYRNPRGSLFFQSDGLTVNDFYKIEDNIKEIRDEAMTDAAVEEVRELLETTK